MTLAIMQPYLFPYLGYFQLVQSADTFLFYDDVSYIRQGWVNRNRILANGEPTFFTVPIEDASSFRNISKTRIHQRQFAHWRGKFLRTLAQNYGRRPACAEVMEMVDKTMNRECEFISDLARGSVLDVLDGLGVRKKIILTSAVYDNQTLAGAERVLDICRREGAATYINASGGRALYDKKTFATREVNLRFLQPNLRCYPQAASNFCPALSILDVLMSVGFQGAKEMLTDYILD